MTSPAGRLFGLGGPKVRRALVAGAMVLGIASLSSGTSYAVEFCNTTPIIGNAAGPGAPFPANPYPSPITVSGLSGTITDVNVRLVDVTTRPGPDGLHWVEDADVLVAAPDNSNVILMSDAGGNNSESSGPVADVNLTLDDQAANPLPADSALTSGTFRPVNDSDIDPQINPDDQWPAPAPAPSGSTTLSTFNGKSPNGTWNLYVADDFGLSAVDINGGWCVDILTTGGGTTSTTGGGGTTTTTGGGTTSTSTPGPTTTTTLAPTTTSSTSTSTTSTSTTSTSTTSTSTTSTSTTIAPTTTTSTTLFPPGTCGGRTATIVGTSGPNTLVGTAGADVILGLGGNDVIRGLGGDDIICAGAGNDSVLGGDGNDRIFGEAGVDQLYGEGGNDTLAGGADPDRVFGGPGNDTLNGDAGPDQCAGEDGTDTAATCEQVISVP